MRKLFILDGVFALGACAAPSTTEITAPGENRMLSSKCNTSPNGCFEQAAKQCSGLYQVVDSYSKAGGTLADLLPGPVTWYYMTYQCGASDGRMPQFPFRGQQYTPRPTANISCTQLGNTTNCYGY